MTGCARVVSVLLLLAAQPATKPAAEEGIRAMLRGDYPAAVRILRPLADDAQRPDPVAQFFLAILYDTGHAGDNGRACGLFLRAARPENPLMPEASALGSLVREQLGAGASVLCIEEEKWQGGPPQAFVLGPDHRIVFADTSITVTHGEKEQRTILLVQPGVAYLPIRYTPLAVTRPASARRDFFQWFGWTPDTTVNPSQWTLGWSLSEVVDDQFIPVAFEPRLAVVNGRTHPDSYDMRPLVGVRVNASGEAEFTIAGGDSPRTEVIPWHGAR